MTDLQSIWEATFTRRWHRHPHLAATVDCIGGHQGRVALLALVLFPTEHALHRAAILHDMGEAAVGDVANPVKAANPDLAAALDRIEAAERDRMGLPATDLDERQGQMLRLCDRLDALLWAAHHRPDLMDRPEWRAARAEVRGLLARFGLLPRLDLLRGAA